MARPKKEIDEDQVFKLASYGLTLREIAAIENCCEDTLRDRFSSAIKEGWQHRNGSLRRKQFEAAMSGNIAMLIWLGKNCLGQSEKIEQVGEVTVKDAVDRMKAMPGGRLNGYLNGHLNGHPVGDKSVPE